MKGGSRREGCDHARPRAGLHAFNHLRLDTVLFLVIEQKFLRDDEK